MRPLREAAISPRVSLVLPGDTPEQRDSDCDCDSEYIVLCRADDEMVPSVVRMLVSALDASGSDIAIGTGGTGGGSVAALSGVHTRATAHRLPALLEHHDLSATMWRRAFWETHALIRPTLPADERGFLARALLLAEAVDVVPEPVTLRQSGHRAPNPAPALGSDGLAVLADRLDDLHEVARSIHDTPLRRHWESTVLEPELRTALAHLVEADPGLRARLVERAALILAEAGPGVDTSGRALQRLTYHLAGRRLVPQLLEAVKADRTGELTLLRSVRHGEAHYGDYPFRADPEVAVPLEVYRLDRELGVRARVDSVRWEGDTLNIEGYAHLGLVDVDGPRSGRLRLALVRSGERRSVLQLPVERVHRPDVTADAREAGYCYDWSGFRTSVRARSLRGRTGWSYGVWRLEATVSGDGVRRSRVVTATSPGAARHPQLLETDGVRIVATTGRGTFAVEVDTLPASVTAAEIRDGRIVLTGEVRRRLPDQGPVRVLVTRASGSTVLASAEACLHSADECRTFTTELSLAALRSAAADEPGGEGDWSLRIALPGVGKTVPLRAAGTLVVTGQDPEITLHRTPHGRVALSCRPPRPLVESARFDGDVLELAGPWPDGRFEMALASRDAVREHRLAPVVSGGRFTLRFTPGAMPSLAGELPLTQGTWRPVVRQTREGGGPAGSSPLVAGPEVLAGLPLRHRVGARTFELTESAAGLELAAGPDLLDDERGAVNQHRLHLVDFPRFVASGLRDEVLFESYESRAYADNARAVLEELVRRNSGLTCRWVVLDGQTVLPEGIEPVRRGSRDYYEALARSRYVVVPNYRPLHRWLETPEEQVVVQTWHGAPYKRIGLDNPRGEALSSRDYLEMLRRETSRWDYLLSPNPTSTPILRQAFGYDGEMLETGYPRTDIFHSPDREEVAAGVRTRLGIPEGKRVVLYAPTMRDDHHYGGNRFGLDLRLDLQKAEAELAHDHVLLVRRHAKVVDTVSGADGVFARDVSLWPDVNELLLATDVLITDYSSLMFDFANTGRPMLFFTYDLVDYRDRLRGLYFDPARMPGPHLRTSDEVVAAIRDVEAHPL
ncbi:MAG: CDP-glycerol glycerophosphotransferase family protein, partial [Spirochaetaceae bacterium]|nr:CDP-glycerol glycerophosphotransferase family protein [Spirochaetaceae bacterium]